MQSAEELRAVLSDDQSKYVDPYWTLVGYFNSLRELGGASRLIDDDIPARLELLAQRSRGKPREILRPLELTSRIGPEQVPAILLELERLMSAPGAVDTLLATNMIQVGVDVDRLGLMVVAGQPKTSAEYIQATSRVGRASPGLVITVLNWARPRDTSHYERSRAYHATLYRHVEGATLTPFSARSRDRALAGVLVAMLRLGRDGWSGNQDAVRYADTDPVTIAARRFISERVTALDPDETVDTEADIRRLQDVWEQMAGAQNGLQYANPFHQATSSKVLLHAAEEMKEDEEGFRVLSSLRDVEAETDLRLVSRQA
jgi:hypothetical protein